MAELVVERIKKELFNEFGALTYREEKVFEATYKMARLYGTQLFVKED